MGSKRDGREEIIKMEITNTVSGECQEDRGPLSPAFQRCEIHLVWRCAIFKICVTLYQS